MSANLTRILAFAAAGTFALGGGSARAASLGLGDATAAGMGGAYTALASGVQAPLWNPANLAAFPTPALQFELLNVAFFAGNDGIRYGDFVKWMADGKLTRDEIHQALNEFPGNSVSIHENFDFGVPFSVAWKQWALTMRFTQFANLGLPRGIFDAISDPRDAATVYQEASTTGTTRDLSGVQADVWAVGTVGFSHAQLIKTPWFDRFAVGGTFNVYVASPRIDVVRSTGDLIVRPNTWQTDAQVLLQTDGMTFTKVNDPGGGTSIEKKIHPLGAWGLGVTLGAAGVWHESTRFSVAIQNIPLRPITWSTSDLRSFTLDNGNRIVNAKTVFDGKPQNQSMSDYLDTLFAPTGGSVEQLEKRGSTTGTMPAFARAGVARDFFGRLLTWSFDYEQGFVNSAVTSTTPRLSTGVEVRPFGPIWPLRAGMSVGGRSGHFATLGTGVRLAWYSLDVALFNEGAFTPFEVPFTSRAKGVGFSLEMRLTF